jgi:GTPase SAR1 family protein
VVVQLWDTAGQERYSSHNNYHLRGADVVILAYDVTKVDSINYVKNKMTALSDNPGRVYIVGLKNSDSMRATPAEEELLQVATREGMHFMYCNQDLGSAIHDLFHDVLNSAMFAMSDQTAPPPRLG